ncbi:MAG: hypothetical protein EZS28_032758 [Streblomastix strix]|uniref:Uncharacterized protein n=1 Tax=Streblomastix strix TaxID=222440 RepID=A0A5J4UM47_9EUKA|nr:MAG: hypothetical protein EZS28_032758 [Streblomastix strix]
MLTDKLRIGVGEQLLQDNQGLMISAEGTILFFNGNVIAGTGTTGSASNGSVNYSAGNTIYWDVNSAGSEDRFYNDGANVQPITLGSVPL